VRRDGDAAADVADDEVQVFVLKAALLAEAQGDLLLIERVDVASR
jgi:hypothetical protein